MPKAKSTTSDSPMPFFNVAWTNLWELADDARVELHKQGDALINLVEGALQGAARYAHNVSERSNTLSREGLLAVKRSGEALALSGRDASLQLIETSQHSVNRVFESARQLANRASTSAKGLTAIKGDVAQGASDSAA